LRCLLQESGKLSLSLSPLLSSPLLSSPTFCRCICNFGCLFVPYYFFFCLYLSLHYVVMCLWLICTYYDGKNSNTSNMYLFNFNFNFFAYSYSPVMIFTTMISCVELT
jgi:hypothetical protein